MKKILVAALLTLCLGVSACGNEKAPASKEHVEVQPEEKEEPGKKEKQKEQKPEKTADKNSDSAADQKATPSKAKDNQNTGNGGEKNTSSHAGSTDSKKPAGGNTGSTENQKPSGGGSTDSQKPSGNNGGSTAQPETPSQPEQPSKPQQPEHTHSWAEETTTVTHEATGHYEDRVVKEAWEEPVYEYRTICNKCNADITDDPIYHAAVECGGSYSNINVQIGTIHHEAVTEQVWVEDSPAYTEMVGTGKYTCSTCGATK